MNGSYAIDTSDQPHLQLWQGSETKALFGALELISDALSYNYIYL